MEGDEQRRRQYEHSSFPRGYVPDARVRPGAATDTQSVRGVQGVEGAERFRSAQLTASRPPTSAAMPVNTNTHDITSFGPYPGPQHYASPQFQGQGGSFQYQSEYAQDPQRQQSYPQQYSSQLMYGVAQQQVPPQPPYDSVAPYQTRQTQPVGAEVLSTQFGVSQYYNPNVGGSTSTPAAVPPHYPTAPYQQPTQYTPTADLDRSTLASSYPGMDPEFTQPPTTDSARPEQRQPDRYDVFYNQYRRALRETNENALRGRLVQAGESLLEISEWLLSNAEALELTKDNQAIHNDRLKLWKDFNYCWLAFLTRQLDDTKRMRSTGQGPAPGQSVLSKTSLQHLGDELTRLCDGLEKSGLVDYEMGVWEEEIIDLLLQCREVANAGNDDPAAAGASQGSKISPGSRQRIL